MFSATFRALPVQIANKSDCKPEAEGGETVPSILLKHVVGKINQTLLSIIAVSGILCKNRWKEEKRGQSDKKKANLLFFAKSLALQSLISIKLFNKFVNN